jgi:ParB-like chromosome segregation protein Spo0J
LLLQPLTENLSVPIEEIETNRLNPNVMPASVKRRLRRNIARSGLYPPLIVRRTDGARYRLIDGHQRLDVLRSLGKETVECVAWDCSENDELLFLATLNTLRGDDSFERRTELLRQLAEKVDVTDLKKLLPDDSKDVFWRLSLGSAEPEALAKSIHEKAAAASAAVSTGYFIARCLPEETDVIERAIAQAGGEGLRRRGRALAEICTAYLEGKK